MLDNRWCISMPGEKKNRRESTQERRRERHLRHTSFRLKIGREKKSASDPQSGQIPAQRGAAALTFVKPAVLEAVEGVEQGHVEEADQLAHQVDGEEAHDHPLGFKKK